MIIMWINYLKQIKISLSLSISICILILYIYTYTYTHTFKEVWIHTSNADTNTKDGSRETGFKDKISELVPGSMKLVLLSDYI